jgi:signal peptidase I
MTHGTGTFEERLLPVLVRDLNDRQRPAQGLVARRSRRRGPIAVAVVVIVAAVATVALISGNSSDAVVTMRVVSPAMEPTLRLETTIFVETQAYASSMPQRGDIVAFRAPSSPSPDLIRFDRVIGLPGDIIVETNGVVSVNGRELDEPYATLDHRSGRWTVQPGDVFLMGDNRPIALDSRWDGAGAIGQIPLNSLIGRVVVGSSSTGHPDVVPGPAGEIDGPTPAAN